MLLQARGVAEMESGNELGQDILKILYASEEEKVAVASDGQLTITSTGGAVGKLPKVDAYPSKVKILYSSWVFFTSNGNVFISSCGWKTITTKDRIQFKNVTFGIGSATPSGDDHKDLILLLH